MSKGDKTLDLYASSRINQGFSSAIRCILKYILLLFNVLIIADAIFLLIHEKDHYQGNFIDDGRHPVSKLFLLMLYLDVNSFLMILIGGLGIIGTRNKSPVQLALYAGVMALVGVASYPDLYASLTELFISLISFVYMLLMKQRQANKAYTELIASIA